MKFSVVITVCNRVAFLKEAIQSALVQIPRPEILVIDDGSQSDARAEIEAIVSKFESVRFIQLVKTSGVSAARNYGVKSAIGDYVVFLDDDDLLMPDFFELAAKEIEPDTEVLIAKSELFTDNHSLPSFRKTNKLFTYHLNKYHHQPISNPGYFLIYCPAIHSMIFRKSLFDKHSFPENLEYGEDRMLLVQLRAAGVEMQTADFTGAKYRIHDQEVKVENALMFIWSLESSSLLKTHFEHSYVSLLKAYYLIRSKKIISSFPSLIRAFTSVGVWKYLMRFWF